MNGVPPVPTRTALTSLQRHARLGVAVTGKRAAPPSQARPRAVPATPVRNFAPWDSAAWARPELNESHPEANRLNLEKGTGVKADFTNVLGLEEPPNGLFLNSGGRDGPLLAARAQHLPPGTAG